MPGSISPYAVQSSPNTPADPVAQMAYNKAAIQVAFLAGLMYTAVGFLVQSSSPHQRSPGIFSGESVEKDQPKSGAPHKDDKEGVWWQWFPGFLFSLNLVFLAS